MNDNSVQWPKILKAYYACSLITEEAELWHYELGEMNPKNAEICAAIKMARNDGLKPDEWKATVVDLRNWLKLYRRRQRALNGAQGNKSVLAGFVSEWKEKMARGCKEDDFKDAAWALRLPTREYNEVCRRVLGF